MKALLCCTGLLALGTGALERPMTPAPDTVAPAAAPVTTADTAKVRLAIKGMTCGSCARTAELALRRVEGVYRAQVSLETATGEVWYDAARTTPEQLIAKLGDLTGYRASVIKEKSSGSKEP